MSFESLLIDAVTVFNPEPATTDRYGNPVDALDSGTSYSARVQQQSAQEFEDGLRDTSLTKYVVFLPRTADVTESSLIDWSGWRHRVVGVPNLVEDGTGPHHYELVMERVQP